jgi:HPt (histidine-containing phosphotransfer) domain-containing protein
MIDLTFLKKFTNDDPKKMKRYISLYLETTPKTFEEMQLNITCGDWEQLRINAHSLKPLADYMGINNLKKNLIEIEDAVKINNIEGIEKLFNSALEIATNADYLLKDALDQF